MKKKKIIILIVFSFSLLIITLKHETILEHIIPNKYYDYDIADDEIRIYNPFQSRENDFDSYIKNAIRYDSIQKPDSAQFYFNKAIIHRNSFNEKQYEELFSCGNAYWEYKTEKLMKYSIAYEKTGALDSAYSVLKPALVIHEAYQKKQILPKKFLQLAIKLYGKNKVLKELKKMNSSKHNIECPQCYKDVYLFFETNVAFDYSLAATYIDSF